MSKVGKLEDFLTPLVHSPFWILNSTRPRASPQTKPAFRSAVDIIYGYKFMSYIHQMGFVLLLGLCTKRRPWSNSLITASLVAPCLFFGQGSCSNLFQALSGQYWRGLRFVLLVGLCTKRRPWSNSMKTAYLVVSCFCFGRESCSNLFQVFSNDFDGVFVFGS